MRYFTKKEDDFLRKNYLTIPAKQMSRMLNRTEGTARQRMKILGLVVPPEIIEKFKRDSYYKKNSVPFNKGKKQAEYVSADKIENTKATRFQKGHKPHNTKIDSAITLRTDKYHKNKNIQRQYYWIRIAEGKWKMLHVKIWEDANGKIPEGCIVVFKDNNSLNCCIENLEVITRAEHAIRNRQKALQYPDELKQAIRLPTNCKKLSIKNQKAYEKQVKRFKQSSF